MMTGLRLLAVGVGFALLSVSATAQRGDGNNAVTSLKGVAVPQPAGLGRYVVDTQALVVLGKALFWDVQVGSDGRTACATCHFHAGADHRVTNQIAGPPTSTAAVRPNTSLTIGDFPFHASRTRTTTAPRRRETAVMSWVRRESSTAPS